MKFGIRMGHGIERRCLPKEKAQSHRVRKENVTTMPMCFFFYIWEIIYYEFFPPIFLSDAVLRPPSR